MRAVEDVDRLGRAIMSIVGNRAMPVDKGPYREEHEHSRARGVSVRHGDIIPLSVRRVYLRPPSLTRSAWSALATDLRRLGWEAEADETGIVTRTLRVTLDTSNATAEFTIAERMST